MNASTPWPLPTGNARPARRSVGIPEALLAAGLPPLARAAWVEVSLDAIEQNVRGLKEHLSPGGHLDVVLKANAYGLGAVEIARAALAAGARAILVATIDEAIALRNAEIRAPLRVLWRVPREYLPRAAALEIGVPATSPAVVTEILSANLTGEQPLIVDVEVDTGLGRDGILPNELTEEVERLSRAHPRIELRGIWSHLTAAEDVKRSTEQAQRLNDAADAMRDPDLRQGLERHLVGSGGLLTIGGGEHVARVGIALFGVVPNALRPSRSAEQIGIAPVYQLIARPVRIATLPVGHGVGYGPHFVAERPSRIITLPMGYADGISYHEKGKAEVLLRGVRLPVVGSIAMDSITIDATDHPASDLSTLDDVVFIGRSGSEEIQPVDVARRRATITNEVSTSFASRLARVYTRGGQPVAICALNESAP
ncbi:MAG: alanine racemase [Chloroflexota bacterium]|jgi:alanine racemase